jgi:hypothetical protein
MSLSFGVVESCSFYHILAGNSNHVFHASNGSYRTHPKASGGGTETGGTYRVELGGGAM